MSKVAKYRRQVSEDPDIDNLLSTLSPEEMEELEKELDIVDPDGSIPLEDGQKNQTENSSPGPQNCDATLNHREKESRKVIQREQSIDESRLSEKSKGSKNEEGKGKETPSKDLARKADTKVGKDSKKEESVQKTDPKGKGETKAKEEKAINDKVKAMEKKLMGKDKKEEEKGSGSALKKDVGKDKKEEEKGSALKKDAAKDKKEEEKGSALKKDAGKDKKEEEKVSALKKDTGKDKKEEEKGSALKKDTGKDKKEEEKSLGSKKEAEKDTKGEDKKEKDKKEEEKSSALKKPKADEKEKSQPGAEKAEGEKREAAAESSASKPGTGSSPDQAQEDEASSIFDELIEKVKNNDAEVTEVNVNNSDCINNETLVRFTEALEFNTVVKLFALANTRADDHVAFAIAIMLKSNKVLKSINLDSNHITGKGILAIFRALLQNDTLTELRFHNQRHICGGKTEMEIAKLLKENTTLLKLGYHFELAGPRMTVTNLLSRNMDKQRQKRLQEQKLAQERGEKKDLLEVPKAGALPKGSPKPSPQPSPKAPSKTSPKKGGGPTAPPPPPPPLAPPLITENLRNSLSPATQRKLGDRALPVQEKNSRDQLLAAIRSSNLKQLKKASVGLGGVAR
ncbi:LMOD1 protein, partial [Pterocles burchelli]|nr:LMOD1 protein [Pterocles burchelli]